MEWQKIMSEKYHQYYWFNTITGESKWTEPEGWNEQQPNKKQRRENEEEIKEQEQEEKKEEESKVNEKEDIDIAIIVPFRDLHIEQKRSEQLARFVPEMTR